MSGGRRWASDGPDAFASAGIRVDSAERCGVEPAQFVLHLLHLPLDGDAAIELKVMNVECNIF